MEIVQCCKSTKKHKKCKRDDGKLFNLPRKFTRKQCENIKGFSMRSSCAPYKMCGKNQVTECIALMLPDSNISNNYVKGIVKFIQVGVNLHIEYDIKNLKNGRHGFHIHKCGDLTRGCSSACEHFNPTDKDHGGLYSSNSHAGDLGNIKSINKRCKGEIITNKINIMQGDIKNVIGRMIIVHEDKDDLGLTKHKESKTTGNAGRRLACGVIGIKQ